MSIAAFSSMKSLLALISPLPLILPDAVMWPAGPLTFKVPNKPAEPVKGKPSKDVAKEADTFENPGIDKTPLISVDPVISRDPEIVIS